MALSNSQYNELMRIYEQRQLDAVHQVQERYERVTQAIPEFAEIDNAISSASIRQARLLLNGETSALADLYLICPQERITQITWISGTLSGAALSLPGLQRHGLYRNE